jgi:outer membrane protein OmpA-like peptidoglycan-associated protein
VNKIFIALGMAGIVNGSFAEETKTQDDYRFYVNGSLARAFGDVGADDMNDRMAELGYQANARVYDQNRNAWEAAFGYRVNSYIDLQLGYLDLGKVTTRLSGNATDIHDYLNSANVVHPRSADGYAFALRGRYYLNDELFLYGRVGLLRADSEYYADADIDQATRTRKENSRFFGIGYEYQWRPRWSFHFSGDIYRIEDENIKVLGLGLAYQFGTKSKPEPAVAPPVQSVVPPEPIPTPVVEPTKQAPLEMELAIVFDSNSAIIKSEFYPELERLVAFMTEHPQVKVVLEGHTDDRGNDQFNQDLSQRRVDAVMTLLINQFGIDGQRLRAQGFGELKPVAGNESADGRMKNRRVVAKIEN